MIKEQCISCGRDDIPLFPTDGAFLPEGYRACAMCQARYSSMSHEADRLMLEYACPEEYHCYNCDDPVVMDGRGKVPMYCRKCMTVIFATYKGYRN